MKAIQAQSLLLAIATTATTLAVGFANPAFAATYGRYAVAVECYGAKCFGIVIDQDSGEAVNVTEAQKNKKRAYRKARKLLEEANGGVVSEEWLRCQQDPAACGGF